jgi:serine/threonine-protein kinase HipA
MACNCDDHVKNISFLMDKNGKWSLAPAYDVTFAYNPAGKWTSSHQMTINGKRKDFQKEDFDFCAKIAGLTNAQKKTAFTDVASGIAKWKEFALKSGVSEERYEAIKQCFCIL